MALAVQQTDAIEVGESLLLKHVMEFLKDMRKEMRGQARLGESTRRGSPEHGGRKVKTPEEEEEDEVTDIENIEVGVQDTDSAEAKAATALARTM